MNLFNPAKLVIKKDSWNLKIKIEAIVYWMGIMAWIWLYLIWKNIITPETWLIALPIMPIVVYLYIRWRFDATICSFYENQIEYTFDTDQVIFLLPKLHHRVIKYTDINNITVSQTFLDKIFRTCTLNISTEENPNEIYIKDIKYTKNLCWDIIELTKFQEA